jgi:MipA family protein
MIKSLLCVVILLTSQQLLAQQISTEAPSVTPTVTQTTPVDASQVATAAEDEFPDRIQGDLGIGVFHSDRNLLDKKSFNAVHPYAYFDYGRFFARLDTFGIKTAKLGNGYLELAARVTFDTMHSERGLNRRSGAVPLGIGTYQETSVGAFFLNAFYDVNQSRGSLLEAIYAAEFTVAAAKFYPQIGVERRSANYNNYFYGVSAEESANSRHHYSSYQAGAAVNPILGLSAEYALNKDWIVNLTMRRKWLSAAISDSPIVRRHTENLAFAVLAYRFK